ncbi:basic blue protein-like [Quercus suber]|uniref:basic blue protein-like n=1 Tax=Quercus suber TaxID=58331 RepID=UPI000CE218CD|nr:basic blue protein-like [Quercus suber]
MAQGRFSLIFATALLLGLFFQCENVWAKTYFVGYDPTGWTFNMEDWPTGQNFKPNDTLVFSYNRGEHNVIVVDRQGHDTCKAPENAYVQSSGFDYIILNKGENYVICNFTGHCEAKMKMAINVL